MKRNHNCLGGLGHLPHYCETCSARVGHERFTLAAICHKSLVRILSFSQNPSTLYAVTFPFLESQHFQASSWCSHFVHWEVDRALSSRGSEITTTLDFLLCTLNSVLAMILDHAAPQGFGRW